MVLVLQEQNNEERLVWFKINLNFFFTKPNDFFWSWVWEDMTEEEILKEFYGNIKR